MVFLPSQPPSAGAGDPLAPAGRATLYLEMVRFQQQRYLLRVLGLQVWAAVLFPSLRRVRL